MSGYDFCLLATTARPRANGQLLDAAEEAGFDFLITVDHRLSDLALLVPAAISAIGACFVGMTGD